MYILYHVTSTDDVMTTSGSTVSPKPVTPPQRSEEKIGTKPLKPVSSKPDSVNAKPRVSEPTIPSPDYEGKTGSLIHSGLTKNKPLPSTPLETKKTTPHGTESSTTAIAGIRKSLTTAEPKRLSTSSDAKKSIITSEIKENKTTAAAATTAAATATATAATTTTTTAAAAPTATSTPAAAAAAPAATVSSALLWKDSRDSHSNHLEEKVNAIFKELLPKVSWCCMFCIIIVYHEVKVSVFSLFY